MYVSVIYEVLRTATCNVGFHVNLIACPGSVGRIVDSPIHKRKPTDVPTVSGLSDIKISKIRTRVQIYALLGLISVASSNFGSKI